MSLPLITVKGERIFNPQHERRPSGHIIINGEEIAHTLQCKHCGKHWVSIKGSGKRRGWCSMCKGPTCGSQRCDVCIPLEARLGLHDGGNVSKTALLRLMGKYSDQIGLLNHKGQSLI